MDAKDALDVEVLVLLVVLGVLVAAEGATDALMLVLILALRPVHQLALIHAQAHVMALLLRLVVN